jgi:hypothetical protein
MTAPAATRILVLAIAAGFISIVGHAQEKPAGKENLFTNASFAEGMQGWNVKVKPDSTAGVDNAELRNGTPTLKISHPKGADTHVTQKIMVKPGTRYKATAYIKTKDVVPDKRGSKAGASLSISGGYQTSEYIQKSKPWAKVELEFESGNLTEIVIGPRLGQYYNTVSGTAWFSDLEVVEVGRARK